MLKNLSVLLGMSGLRSVLCSLQETQGKELMSVFPGYYCAVAEIGYEII